MENNFASFTNRNTNPALSPERRAHQAFNCAWSCDWNEETQEFNPYPKGSVDYRAYEREMESLMGYAHDNGYDF